MSFVLLVYKDNWADEMDLEGFVVTTSSYWNKCRKVVKELYSFTFGIGSNQQIEYDSADAFLKKIKSRRITEDDANMYRIHFGKHYNPNVLVQFGPDFLGMLEDYIPEEDNNE